MTKSMQVGLKQLESHIRSVLSGRQVALHIPDLQYSDDCMKKLFGEAVTNLSLYQYSLHLPYSSQHRAICKKALEDTEVVKQRIIKSCQPPTTVYHAITQQAIVWDDMKLLHHRLVLHYDALQNAHKDYIDSIVYYKCFVYEICGRLNDILDIDGTTLTFMGKTIADYADEGSLSEYPILIKEQACRGYNRSKPVRKRAEAIHTTLKKSRKF